MCSLNKTPFYFYKLPNLTKYLKKKAQFTFQNNFCYVRYCFKPDIKNIVLRACHSYFKCYLFIVLNKIWSQFYI
jgi:hypothetical protein